MDSTHTYIIRQRLRSCEIFYLRDDDDDDDDETIYRRREEKFHMNPKKNIHQILFHTMENEKKKNLYTFYFSFTQNKKLMFARSFVQ